MDLALPGAAGRVNFLVYSYAETAQGKPDPLEPDFFTYKIAARELSA